MMNEGKQTRSQNKDRKTREGEAASKPRPHDGSFPTVMMLSCSNRVHEHTLAAVSDGSDQTCLELFLLWSLVSFISFFLKLCFFKQERVKLYNMMGGSRLLHSGQL